MTEQTAQRRQQRQRERDERMKATAGYKVFNVMFMLAYPFIAVFTFLMSGLLAVSSAVSRGLAWVASGGKTH